MIPVNRLVQYRLRMSFLNTQADVMTRRLEPNYHRPVMLEEVVDFLHIKAGQTIVDCTLGTGGHSLALLPHLMPLGRLIAMDHDEQALKLAQARLAEFGPRIHYVHDSFANLPDALNKVHVAKVHGLVADLGISSLHVDQPERGFSFLKDGPLDMRMDSRRVTTAAALVRQLSEDDLAMILEVYGEERWARRIARRIVQARAEQPIVTTTQLARIVTEAIPPKFRSKHIHAATRTFQALRIAVNDELTSLKKLLDALPVILAPGGRAVIITFHSLEDRMVKYAFRQGAEAGQYRLLTKKVVRPADDELVSNARSRSAKLRAIERI